MLRISKLTDYAAIIMGFLAVHPDQVYSATRIADEIHIPSTTVSKLLKLLSEATLVTSTRGTTGGYRLAREATDIAMMDLITAIEGNPAITECCNIVNSCELDSLCAIKDNWKMINKAIMNTLANLTLSDMVRPLSQEKITLRGIPVSVQGF